MNTDVLNNIANFNPFNSTGISLVWIGVKILVIGALLVYSVYSGIIVKQVQIMSATLDDPANRIVKMFAIAHLVMAIFLTIAAVVVL